MPREWPLRVQDILESIQKILRYTDGMSQEEFDRDERTFDAVVRNFLIIGEAANFIPEEIEETHPDVPWGQMRGMRNVLVHVYFGIDSDIIWQTIREDLRPLVPQLKAILE